MVYNHLPEEVIDENCVYFLRNTPGMVPLPNSIEEANEMLPSFFEFGILNGHSLIMLEQIIGQVCGFLHYLNEVWITVMMHVDASIKLSVDQACWQSV